MDNDAYQNGMNWAHTLALLSDKVPAAEMVAFINTTETVSPIMHPELFRAGSERLEMTKRYLEVTVRWQEAARTFVVEMRKTGAAAARARDAIRRDAQQEQTAAGAPAEPGEKN
jgi:hypothetical protein